jgi:hypothetical protein
MCHFKYLRKSFSHNDRRNFKQIRAVLGQAGKRNEVAMNGLAKYCEQPDTAFRRFGFAEFFETLLCCETTTAEFTLL